MSHDPKSDNCLALVRLTATALARLLGLPEGAQIDAVCQSPEDMASDGFTFRIRGVGDAHRDGFEIRYFDLTDLQGNG